MRIVPRCISLACSLAILMVLGSGRVGRAQEIESIGNGLRQLKQGPLTLITDLPIDSELKTWPEVLSQAIAQWKPRWESPRADAPRLDEYALTAYLIGDRERFRNLGLLDGIPAFEDGYQQADRIYLVEQPSTYYRRHLFLHEATHWMMYRLLGGAGSPWFMEGMADLYGTHRWTDHRLQLGVIPDEPREVPNWGRFKRLQDSIDRDAAPGLDQILAYQSTSPDRMDRYVWSWAACVFFSHHPSYRDRFQKVAEPPLDYSLALSERFRAEIADRWPIAVAEWNGFISDFDFGFDPDRSMVQLFPDRFQALAATSTSRERELECDRGWQSTDLLLQRGQRFSIRASGSYTIRRNLDGSEWRCEPQGITLRYVDGIPLGRLVATVVPLDGAADTIRWKKISIGRDATLVADQDGLLLIKINEAAGELQDNAGRLSVTVRAIEAASSSDEPK